MDETLEKLVANFSGQIRREKLFGRDFLVAPMTMIVPGVLNGSRGAILYELRDMASSVYAWNAMPIVKDHPTDQQGNSISARTPDVLRERGMGYVFNTLADSKLGAEAWFDIEATKRISPETLFAVENGQPVEISTGLNLALDPTQGVWNAADGTAVQYAAIARNYRPDHLAIITEGEGACSRKDGCGVNNSDKKADEADHKLLQKVINAIKSLAPAAKDDVVTANKETVMALKPGEKTTIINRLCTNCACWKGKEAELEKSDDAVLSALNKGLDSEDALNKATKTIKENETVINAAKKGMEVGDTKFTLNEKGEWVSSKKEVETPAPVTNKGEDKKVDLKEEDLPESVRRDLAYGREQRIANRKKLVTALVGNIEDTVQRTAETKKYMDESKYSDAQLGELVEIANRFGGQKVANQQPQEDWVAPYLGAGAGGFNNGFETVNATDRPTPIPIIDIDYAELAKQH